jgi:hypothetical protein
MRTKRDDGSMSLARGARYATAIQASCFKPFSPGTEVGVRVGASGSSPVRQLHPALHATLPVGEKFQAAMSNASGEISVDGTTAR